MTDLPAVLLHRGTSDNTVRTGIVEAVNGDDDTLTVRVQGRSLPGITAISGYVPVVGDVVALIRQQASWMAIGRLGTAPSAVKVFRAISTAGGTGVTTTETKDATGDLAFETEDGGRYEVTYFARAIAGAAGHGINVNIRDGGAASPTNASTLISATTVLLSPSVSAPVGVWVHKVLYCPTDITVGTHTFATFYVRNSALTVTSVVQLENAGPNRQLVVKILD